MRGAGLGSRAVAYGRWGRGAGGSSPGAPGTGEGRPGALRPGPGSGGAGVGRLPSAGAVWEGRGLLTRCPLTSPDVQEVTGRSCFGLLRVIGAVNVNIDVSRGLDFTVGKVYVEM